MTTSQKNQAIADKCPGKFKYRGGIGWYFGRDNEDWTRCLNGSIIDDLNAMAVAEETLVEDDRIMYRVALIYNADGPKTTYPSVESALCHATSHRRADAFGKVMGIWE